MNKEKLLIGGFSFDCEIEEHSKKERRSLGYPLLDMFGLDPNKPIIQQDEEIKYSATMRNHKLDRKHIADLQDRIVAFGPTSKHGVFTGVITNVEYSTEEIIIEYMPDTQPRSKIWQER